MTAQLLSEVRSFLRVRRSPELLKKVFSCDKPGMNPVSSWRGEYAEGSFINEFAATDGMRALPTLPLVRPLGCDALFHLTGRRADHLGPLARNWDDISERARIHFGVSKEEWARRTGGDEEQTKIEGTQLAPAQDD